MSAILRFIIGIVTFCIGIVVMKFVLFFLGVALHLLWIAIVVGALALIGYFVFKIMFPSRAESI